MSAMFEYITGKKEGKVPQLEASLEHALGLLEAEIDDGVKYRAEIERLRAALIEIVEKGKTTGYGRGALRSIANRALSHAP